MGMPSAAGTSSERWCNQLTAEILIPREELLSSFDRQNDLTLEIHRLSRLFRASKYVVAQSLWDARLIDWDTFEDERTRIRDAWGAGPSPVGSEGGQFYNSETSRVGRRFGRALISDTLSGNTLFTDAYRLLSTAKHETFMKLAAHLGVT
jgi:hypothetical protein